MIERVKIAIAQSARGHGVSFTGVKEVARAAIAAMREPTQEMIDAGCEAEEYGCTQVWRYMIDAALDDHHG